jgi:hypothetical protein
MLIPEHTQREGERGRGRGRKRKRAQELLGALTRQDVEALAWW